ncbi:hypothetical protein, partial [Xanthomonas populi]|uniref:hypothetical protein n=1 Tax=Xanthomonas populi TaxID=53414 RepID=UPI001ABF4CF8
ARTCFYTIRVQPADLSRENVGKPQSLRAPRRMIAMPGVWECQQDAGRQTAITMKVCHSLNIAVPLSEPIALESVTLVL